MLAIFAIYAFVLQSCGTSVKKETASGALPAIPHKDGTVCVGTFNVEWLGDGIKDQKPRTDEDYKSIAEVISNTGADVLGVEEVENDAAIKNVMQYLPGYSYFCGVAGNKQNVAVIYKNDIKVNIVGEYIPLSIEVGRNRPGLVLECKKGNFDWTMMVVHLKSTSYYDKKEGKEEESRQRRAQQAAILGKWMDSIITNSKEKDVVILGDFNDNPARENTSLKAFLSNPNYMFLTDKLATCSENKKYDNIDQIVVSTSAKKRVVPGSVFMYNYRASLPSQVAEKISDHCPVTVAFDITQPDND